MPKSRYSSKLAPVRARPLRSPSASHTVSRKSRGRSSAMSIDCSPSRLPTRLQASLSAACAPSCVRRALTRSPSRLTPPGYQPSIQCVAAYCFRMPSMSVSIRAQTCSPRTRRRRFPPSRSMRCCRTTQRTRASSCFSTILASRVRRSSSTICQSCSCSHRAAGMISTWGQLLRRLASSPVACKGSSPRIRGHSPSSTSWDFPRAR